MNIEIIQEDTRKSLLAYESDLIPQIGDDYAGMNFKDGHQRTIVKRLIFPKAPDFLNVYVKYSHPQLIPKEQKELSETELNLISQELLS